MSAPAVGLLIDVLASLLGFQRLFEKRLAAIWVHKLNHSANLGIDPQKRRSISLFADRFGSVWQAATKAYEKPRLYLLKPRKLFSSAGPKTQ
jgi:hypothetical protein